MSGGGWIKSLFFGKRTNILPECDIGELTVLLPEFDEDSDPVLYLEFRKKKSIHFACPINSSILDIKLRIRGYMKMPTERLILFYQGRIMDDDEVSTV
jgi:hypothetical protein